MTGPQWAAVGILFSIGTGLVGIYFVWLQSIRASKAARAKEIDDAVAAACKPLQDQVRVLTADRDYYRNRVDALEDDARRKRGN